MKTWLKGGLIGGGIYVLIYIILLIFGSTLFAGDTSLLFIMLPCIWVISCSGEGCMACVVLGPFINLILSFALGSIIGYIIQKIKSRKQGVVK